MSRKANPTAVGAFVVGALALSSGAALAMTGWSRALEHPIPLTARFERASVAGLSVGQPVRFRGVDVGEVTRIHAEYSQSYEDERAQGHPLDDLHEDPIIVIVDLDFHPERIRIPDDVGLSSEDPQAHIRPLLKNGLYARLETDSFVTGTLYVALEFDQELVRNLRFKPNMPGEIPTDSQDLLTSLQELDLKSLENQVSELLSNLNTLISDDDIPTTIAELKTATATLNSETLVSLNDLLKGLKPAVEHLSEQASATLTGIEADLGKVMSETSSTLTELRAVIRDDSPSLLYRTNNFLDEGTETLKAIRSLVDYLETHPEALLLGRGR